MNKNRLVFAIVISTAIIILVSLAFFIVERYENKKNLIDQQFVSSNQFPLQTMEDSGFVFLKCELRNVKYINEIYAFGTNTLDKINVKATSDCIYQDINNNNQSVSIVLASIIETPEGFFTSFGNIASTTPLSGAGEANLYTGEILISDWERIIINSQVTLSGNQITNGKISEGDIVKLTMAQTQNEIIQENIRNPNGLSDHVYGKGFATHINLSEFFNTGNPESLPNFNNSKLLPTLRVSLFEDI